MIVITGTTRDLGHAIHKKILANNILSIEINFNEYDLCNSADIIKIIDKLSKYNITGCINNSYANGIGQLEFLFAIANYFGNDDTKFIINLGSINKDRNVFQNINQIKYSVYKRSLDDATTRINLLFPLLNIHNITLPMCDTSYNIHKNDEKISTDSVADLIFNYIKDNKKY